jgi:hypothetical protein
MQGNIYTTDVNYNEVICNVDIEYQVNNQDVEILGVKINKIKAMSGSLIDYEWLDEHNWLVPLEEKLYKFLNQNLWKLYLWDDLIDNERKFSCG